MKKRSALTEAKKNAAGKVSITLIDFLKRIGWDGFRKYYSYVGGQKYPEGWIHYGEKVEDLQLEPVTHSFPSYDREIECYVLSWYEDGRYKYAYYEKDTFHHWLTSVYLYDIYHRKISVELEKFRSFLKSFISGQYNLDNEKEKDFAEKILHSLKADRKDGKYIGTRVPIDVINFTKFIKDGLIQEEYSENDIDSILYSLL